MTTIDIKTEPGNNTFVVWYDPNREPYAVYFRSDANAWGDQRWFNADQHHSGGTEPSEWHELCDELFGNNGPHLLVPGAEVAELTAERDAARDHAQAARREAANALRALDTARPVIEAAKAWRSSGETGGIQRRAVADLIAAVDALPKTEVTS